MAIPVAPTITQTTTEAPVPAGNAVADLNAAEAESYALTNDGGGLFTISGASITAVSEIAAGDYDVAATATNAEGTGPEATATLSFANTNIYDDTDDPYAGNPNLPPPFPEGTTPADAWDCFLVAATHAVVPHARNGVDFVVARASKTEPNANVYWDDTVLGPRPDAEIEVEARRLASEWPSGVLVKNM